MVVYFQTPGEPKKEPVSQGRAKKPTEWFGPAAIGGTPSVLTGRTLRLLEADVLAKKERAPRKHLGQRQRRRKQLLLPGNLDPLNDRPRHAESAS